MSTPFAERPTGEVVVAELDALQADIREAVSAAVPSVAWEPADDESGTTCGEPGSYGRLVSLQGWVADGVSDAEWPVVVAATASAADGFAGPITIADNPGDHTVELAGPNGAVVRLGSTVNMVLSVYTGCHPW